MTYILSEESSTITKGERLMKKRFINLFMSSALLIGLLAGCGASGTSGSGDTIKIGANLELSGAVASYGQSILEGMELAVEEINDDGGIDGKKFEIIDNDNKSDGAEAVSIANKFTSEEKVLAIVGAATSGNTKAQIEIANDTETILLTPSGTSPELTVNKDGSVNEFVFRTSYIDPFQGEVAANFAVNELGVSTAAVYIDNASDYSIGLAESFVKTFESLGGKVVIKEAYVAGDTDYRSTLTRISSEEPEFIFIPGYYGDVGLIISQAREIGIDVPLMGADGWDSPELVDLAGKDALNNTFITNHYSSGDPDEKIQSFVNKFGEKYKGKSPDAFNALGYDSIYLLADAIKRAGSTDSKEVKDALAKTENLSLITGLVTINENHDPIKSATILEYVDGTQTFKAKVDPE